VARVSAPAADVSETGVRVRVSLMLMIFTTQADSLTKSRQQKDYRGNIAPQFTMT
jgi:hypothetical protein